MAKASAQKYRLGLNELAPDQVSMQITGPHSGYNVTVVFRREVP